MMAQKRRGDRLEKELDKFPLPTCTHLLDHDDHDVGCDMFMINDDISDIKTAIAHNTKKAHELYDAKEVCEAMKFELENRKLFENLHKLSEHKFLLYQRDDDIKMDRIKTLQKEIIKLADATRATAKLAESTAMANMD